MIKILAISGSLRRLSSNTALLHAAASLAPPFVEITLYPYLRDLPLFNPDLEEIQPQSVKDFRAKLHSADGVLIASPEYAHGITGAMKNALDWVVRSGEFVNKYTALLSASSRAIHAPASLREIIKTMDGKIVPEASLVIPLPHNQMSQTDILADPYLRNLLNSAIEAFVSVLKKI